MKKNTLNITVIGHSGSPDEVVRRLIVTNIIHDSLKKVGFTNVEVDKSENTSVPLIEAFSTLLDFVKQYSPSLFKEPIVITDHTGMLEDSVSDNYIENEDYVLDRMDKYALKEARLAMRSKSRNIPL